MIGTETEVKLKKSLGDQVKPAKITTNPLIFLSTVIIIPGKMDVFP